MSEEPTPSPTARWRHIPSVDRLLQEPLLRQAAEAYGRRATVEAVRKTLARVRAAIGAGRTPDLSTDTLVQATLENLARQFTPSLHPVINATGVIIHTNLGRAPLSQAALEAMRALGSAYSNLEYDLEAGRRGSRYAHVGELLAELTGAEAGVVANNNAAALVLILATLAAGREVLISRAHLVEIGGGFRIPDIMAQSGAVLREVGTTNRTYAHDYERAVGAHTAMILRVHTSNFQILGFVHQPSLAELADLAHRYGLVLADDVGSGALLDTTAFGLAYEPRPQESVAAGADVVCFSGDKLLGGPQAGCIVGRKELIEAIKRHPLMRAFRVDKVTLAGLEATLQAYRKGMAVDELPVWRMIARPPEELRAAAQKWAEVWRRAGLDAEVIPGRSAVGGGSLPGQTLPTWLVAVHVSRPSEGAAALRCHHPPVIVRIEDDRLLVDPRTVLPGQEDVLCEAISHLA